MDLLIILKEFSLPHRLSRSSSEFLLHVRNCLEAKVAVPARERRARRRRPAPLPGASGATRTARTAGSTRTASTARASRTSPASLAQREGFLGPRRTSQDFVGSPGDFFGTSWDLLGPPRTAEDPLGCPYRFYNI